MEPLYWLLLKVTGAVAAFAALAWLMVRSALAARKSGRAGVGGQLIGTALMFFSFGTALDPAREVTTETRKLKRKSETSADPPDPDSVG